MKKMGLAGVIVAASMAVNCNIDKLPAEFQSADFATQQYMQRASEAEGTIKINAYNNAVAATNDQDMKRRLAAYASNQLLRESQTTRSIVGAFSFLEAAIELEPDQENKEGLIDYGKKMVDFHGKNSYSDQFAAHLLMLSAYHTKDPDKRTTLANLAADLYERIAKRAAERRYHNSAIYNSELAQRLRSGNF